jgi:diacylglycerol kinase family enzyme
MAAPDGWLVVGSTAAGSSGEESIAAVAGHLSRRGPVESAITSGPDDLEAALHDCGGRTLVVVGGDGSAHVVVNALERLGLLGEVTVGFVPLGTANDLATHLGMSSDPRTAAEQLLDGAPHQLDLLRLTGERVGGVEIVVNALHAGLGVDGARRARPLKPVLGPVAYPVGVAASGIVSRGSAVAVTVDGEEIATGAAMLAVAVANAPRLGGVELMAGADPTDGLLDVLTVPARPWTARLGTIARSTGRSSRRPDTRRGQVVEIEGDLGEVDADGEMIRTGARCRIEVDAGALRAIRPSSG